MGLLFWSIAVLPWVFFGAAAGIVTAAAVRGPVSYVNSTLIGAVIGMVCGLVRSFAIVLIDEAIDQSDLYSQGLVDAIVTRSVSILITTGFTAAIGAAVAVLVARSTTEVRRCVVSGLGYGLLIGCAGMVVFVVLRYVFPQDFEGKSIADLHVVTYLVVAGVLDVGLNIGLTVIAFMWVRRRRLATWPAPDRQTC